ncbi:MAG: alpha/beta fold hydrolase [Syntrophorhabdaceae bacterium]
MTIETYGSGIPIVFIHGAGGSMLSWVFQRTYFEKTHRVVLVDLPGHGKSEEFSVNSIGAYADSMRAALRETNIDGAFLTGHSMGGAIALDLALRYPDLVKGLILIGTGARLKVYPEILNGIISDKEKTSRMIVDTAFSETIPESLKARVLTEYLKNDSMTVFNDFTACDGFNVMDRLTGIMAPTLVVCGQEDRFTPVKYSYYLSEKIPGAELKIIDGAGHMVMIEKPDQTNRAIETFMDSLQDEAGSKSI